LDFGFLILDFEFFDIGGVQNALGSVAAGSLGSYIFYVLQGLRARWRA